MMTQKEITGYTWANENAAKSAQALAKSNANLPRKEGDIVTEAILPIPNYTNEEGTEISFWYWEGEIEGNVQLSKKFIINEYL